MIYANFIPAKGNPTTFKQKHYIVGDPSVQRGDVS